MKLDGRTFAAIERLIHALHDEDMSNAQGDNGYDQRVRRERYRAKLEKLLNRKGVRHEEPARKIP